MPVRYRPYAEVVQWTGTNVIEVRQFVRSNVGLIRDAVIRDGVLYLIQVAQVVDAEGLPIVVEVPVQVGEWVVRTADYIQVLADALFQRTFEPDV